MHQSGVLIMAKGSAAITKFYEAAKKKANALTQYKRQEREARPLRRAGVALTATTAAAAGAYLDGRFGGGEPISVGPVPVMPVVGLTAVAVGILDAVPGSEYVNAAGTGLLISYLADKARRAGEDAAAQ